MSSERRKTKRVPVVESFSLFVVVPKKGDLRLPIQDVSESGIGFELDLPEEVTPSVTLEKGEVLDVHLYLNQTLSIPLKVKVVRLIGATGQRRVGAELADPKSRSSKALQAFLHALDLLSEAAT